MSPYRPRAPRPPKAPEAPPAAPEHAPSTLGPVILTITASITIPAVPGYGRRLTNLIADLRAGIEEEAPWLSNVQITVDRPGSTSPS